MPKGAGEWGENEPLSASKLNANDQLNLRNLRVGPGLGLQRNANSGDGTLTLDPSAYRTPIVRVLVTELPSYPFTQPDVVGVRPWGGVLGGDLQPEYSGPQFYAKVTGIEALRNVNPAWNNGQSPQLYDILVMQPWGGVPLDPGDLPVFGGPDYGPNTLLDPYGEPVTWIQIGKIDRIFWGAFSVFSGPTGVGGFVECFPFTNGAGGLWNVVIGGRSGTCQNYVVGTQNITPQLGPNPLHGFTGAICLVFESIDYGTQPPSAVYHALTDTNVLVTVGLPKAGLIGYYDAQFTTGYFGNNGASSGLPPASGSRTCILCNLEEVSGGLVPPAAGPLLAVSQCLQAQVFSCDNTGLPIVIVSRGTVARGNTTSVVGANASDTWSCPGGYYSGPAINTFTQGGFNVTLKGSTNLFVLNVDALGRVVGCSNGGAAPATPGTVTGAAVVGLVSMIQVN